MSAVAAFPWDRLPRLTRVAVEARRELRRRVARGLELARVPAALHQLLGEDVEITSLTLNERRRGELGVPSMFDAHTVQFPGLGVRVTLWPEPDLARACVARLLGQGFELGWADAGIDAALQGAGAALALEVARRTALAEAPELVSDVACDDGWVSSGRATLQLGGKPYRVELCVEALKLGHPVSVVKGRVDLSRLGEARIAVPWVAACSTATAAEVDGLQVGDVWVPGDRAWVGGDTTLASGLLAAPGSDRGLPTHVSGGRIVLGAKAVLVFEELSSMSQEESELTQIVGETPLCVRVELGSLEMSAAEWAALRPGDVVESGRRIDEPVVLRVGGREIARGELVDIDGEVGVRITSVGQVLPAQGSPAQGSSAQGSSAQGSPGPLAPVPVVP
jgi:flagellar motor switch/type III secretory pathway protein FliN